MRPILGIFLIAGSTIILTGCDPAAKKSGDAFLSIMGVTTSVDVPVYGIAEVSGETEAGVVPVAEPAPPVCRIEWHRAGTMQVEICE